MALLMAHYRVKDVAVFTQVFNDFQPVRAEHGATGHRLLRAVEDPTVVVVLMEFPDAASATAFVTDAQREAALQRAGVIERSDLVLEGDPAVTY